MGKRGGRKGGRGRGGGGGAGRPRPDNRDNKANLVRSNERFERYYNELGIIPDEEKEQFWNALRRDLPNSFRFTGSKAHALAVQERLRDYYIPEIKSIQYEGQYVAAPEPVEWYPDKLAWYMTTPKNVVRRFKPFASFQKFLVAETDIGNITRQEVVSMIPPLVMDLKPGMTVLDLCAAPGSKSAQLLEMINSGEEDRAREVASQVSNGMEISQDETFADDGRSTGLLIANDVDYKRAHMLVHQMKRLSSPNLIVTNHDATIYPSIKISASQAADGKLVQNRYLKFDRILADVPCSGDGTPRKNVEIWKQWTPSNGLGLHQTQNRILIRALQMLKVGGRVVYSTCSMNPVEDEAVLAAAIAHCGGSDIVELIETKDMLPGLQRSPGLRKWSVMDKAGRIWSDWAAVEKQRSEFGEEGLTRLQPSMFAPDNDLPLDRAMRVYPHTQDTGAFFIAILEKKSEIRVHSQPKAGIGVPNKVKVEASEQNGTAVKMETSTTGEVMSVVPTQNGHSHGEANAAEESTKRKREEAENGSETSDTKRPKTEEIDEQSLSTSQPLPSAPAQNPPPEQFQNKRKNRDQPFEEPFKYIGSNIPELESIKKFYNISDRFPMDRFMVRNADGLATKNIYYTTSLAKEILQENEGKGMKFVHSGVKMFVKQDAPAPDVCPWRIQTDGLRILETWVGKERIVTLRKKETLRKLLIEMFPRFQDDNWQNLGELGDQMRNMSMGCCVLIVEPTEDEGGFSERMFFPLWKSIHSVNLMLPKEDRKAMLLRLFNDDTPLVNMNQLMKDKQRAARSDVPAAAAAAAAAQEGDAEQRESKEEAKQHRDDADARNTSSPEPQVAGEADAQSEDDDDGGMPIDS